MPETTAQQHPTLHAAALPAGALAYRDGDLPEDAQRVERVTSEVRGSVWIHFAEPYGYVGKRMGTRGEHVAASSRWHVIPGSATTPVTEDERRRAYGMTMPASRGETVCQGHADWCAEHGHAVWTIDGEVQGTCPRCGEVTEAETVTPAVAELVELVEQNMGVDRLVSDAADFFTDPGGVLGYLMPPTMRDQQDERTHEDAREAFRVIARKHAGDLDDSGEAARHYLATGQPWAGTLTPAPANEPEQLAVRVTTTDGERLRIYGPAGELLGEHFIGQASGAEWIGLLASTLVRVEHKHNGGMSYGELLADVANTLRGFERAADEAAVDEQLGGCEWFATCGRPATHVEPHPVITAGVPACDVCPKIGR